MAKQQTVTVKHENGSEAQVLPASVGLYLRKGWTLDEESLEREGDIAPLTEADKAKIEAAVKAHGSDEEPESTQERSIPATVENPEGRPDGDLALPKGEGSDPDAKEPVVEVVDTGAAGQPGENGSSDAGDLPGRRGRR